MLSNKIHKFKNNQKQEKKKWQEEYSDIDDQEVLKNLPQQDELQDQLENEQVEADNQGQFMQQEEQIEQQQLQQEGEQQQQQESQEEQQIPEQKGIEWLDSDIDINDIKDDDDDEEEPEIEDLQDEKDARTAFVGDLPLKLTDEQIKDIFSKYGTIISLIVPRNEGQNLNKGRAFIEYDSVESVQNLVKNVPKLGKKDLFVKIEKLRKQRSRSRSKER